MPLETATYTHDLVVSNPAHTDGLSQADSHIRLLKSVIQNTFPNFTDVALVSTQAQIDLATSQAQGLSSDVIPKGTAALPGLAILADLGTGIWQPTAGQLAISISGSQQLLMGTSIITSLPLAAAAIATTGAYSGGTGQLVPIGAVLEWYDDTLPVEGGYCWANGQIIASANTVCPVLLARWGTRFGGNGITTMGVPDRRNTVGVGKDTMGAVASRGLLANITSSLLTTIGSLFGSGTHTLTAAEIPPISAVNNNAPVYNLGSGTTVGGTVDIGDTTNTTPGGSFNFNAVNGTGNAGVTGTITINSGTLSTLSNNTGGAAHSIEQPSTTCNYILRLA